jgi:hypothetical protein
MKNYPTIIVLLVLTSVFAQAQTFEREVQSEIIAYANSLRRSYGFWRIDNLPVLQAKTDSAAMVFYRDFKNCEGITDPQLEEYYDSISFGNNLERNGIVNAYLMYGKTKEKLMLKCEESFPHGDVNLVNPLAYRVSISVVSDSSGNHFVVIATYR